MVWSSPRHSHQTAPVQKNSTSNRPRHSLSPHLCAAPFPFLTRSRRLLSCSWHLAMAESPENAAPAPTPSPEPAPAPAPASAPSSPPLKSGIPPRYDLDAKWDACLDLSIRRVAYSSLAGAVTGLLLFRKEPHVFPIALCVVRSGRGGLGVAPFGRWVWLLFRVRADAPVPFLSASSGPGTN